MIQKLRSFVDPNSRKVNVAVKAVTQINDFEAEIANLTFEQMRAEVAEFRAKLALLNASLPEEHFLSLRTFNRGAGLQGVDAQIHAELLQFMPRFYAMVREVMKRKMDRRHFDIQLAAGVILAEGQRLVEIKTGEGKTQIFFLPTFLFSLAGRGSHSITVNDYLARRDGEYAGHVAVELGLSVGIVTPEASYKFVADDRLAGVKGEEFATERAASKDYSMSAMRGLNLITCSKQEAYDCDITFGTNNEFGFDYLRDNMAWNSGEIVQRELFFCAVDEADSVLIDEARTPLIISSPAETSSDLYQKFAEVVAALEEEKDYVIDYKFRSVTLTEAGLDRAAELIGIDNVWESYATAHHLENALKARALFVRDDHYIIRNGEVLIVDQFTGRVLPGRRYSEGLHQAIEAKEHVTVQQESKTFATISFQNLFRLYKVLIGGSGTIETEKEEFFKIYGLDTVVLPTNKPVVRQDKQDRIYRSQEAKFKAVAAEVKELNTKGQPVLVGTTSIERSELLSAELDRLGVPHQVLNAKYHEQEAQIVARAGEKGAVTVATNMAGRGTDIPLGEGVVDLGGLAVIGTERHEARRIDNQLRGRSGRQGDPGYSRFYVAMDDQIMKMLGGDILKGLMDRINVPDDQPIEMGFISKRIEDAQKKVEWANFDARKSLVEYDDVMNQQREVFYSRRRKFLLTAETSLGTHVRANRVVNTSEVTDATEKQEQARITLQIQLQQLLETEVDNILTPQYIERASLSQEAAKIVVAEYLDMFIDLELAHALHIESTVQLPNYLKDEIAGKKQEAVAAQLKAPIAGLIRMKLDTFEANFYNLYKLLKLEAMNNRWVDHLEHMLDVREAVRLQGYAQRDPLVEYKSIAYTAFQSFVGVIDSEVARRFLKVQSMNTPTTPQLMTNSDEITDIDTGDREFTKGAEKRTENLNRVIQRISKQANAEQSRLREENSKSVTGIVSRGDMNAKKYGRNDKVSVRYTDGKELIDVKYKKVEEDLAEGKCVVI